MTRTAIYYGVSVLPVCKTQFMQDGLFKSVENIFIEKELNMETSNQMNGILNT